MVSRAWSKDLELVGGRLCLDLVNTVDPRHKAQRDEYLDSYRALVEWAAYVGALPAPTAERLARIGDERPAQAERVRTRATTLRDALYDLFAPARRPATIDDGLAVLNEELHRAFAQAVLTRDGDKYALNFVCDDQLDQMLWPIARSAHDLLLSPSRHRVKECDGDGCGWLFLDMSKAGRRRWCSMASCGNRTKVQRYRHRQGGPPA
jgi:predicted RNA-binding Zn ribbon-like protein